MAVRTNTDNSPFSFSMPGNRKNSAAQPQISQEASWNTAGSSPTSSSPPASSTLIDSHQPSSTTQLSKSPTTDDPMSDMSHTPMHFQGTNDGNVAIQPPLHTSQTLIHPQDPSNSIVATQQPSSSLQTQQIRIKNRRKAYLERNPQYFLAADLELADPLQYDRCIRRFQSAAEREADGKAKGWSGVLEADLYRSEAKIAALKEARSAAGPEATQDSRNDPEAWQESTEIEDAPSNREEGLERWKYEMTMRFLHGQDSDFSYKEVDENEEFDELEIREEQDKWFEDEEPEWSSDVASREVVAGETGIQDF